MNDFVKVREIINFHFEIRNEMPPGNQVIIKFVSEIMLVKRKENSGIVLMAKNGVVSWERLWHFFLFDVVKIFFENSIFIGEFLSGLIVNLNAVFGCSIFEDLIII